MINLRMRFNGSKVRVKDFGVAPLQMLRLGAFGLQKVKDRVAGAIGLDDAPMPPLARKNRFTTKTGKVIVLGPEKGYIGRKIRRGDKPIRDLRYTGAMLDNLTVRSATATQVRIAFTTTLARQKALANQQRAPWLGWSNRDAAAVQAKAAQLFKRDISLYAQELKRQFRRAA